MRNGNKANQRHAHKVMQKQAQYERELFSGRRELPRVRHANHTVNTLFNQWGNLSLTQQFMILLVISTVIFPVASGSHEYNSAAPVLKNPYAIVPKSLLTQIYTELSNLFFTTQSDDEIITYTSINECHYLVPLTSTGSDFEERTVMCVRNLEMPDKRKFKDAEQAAIEFLQIGKKANYLAVLYAWPRQERLKLIKRVDKQITASNFPRVDDKLFNALPKEGLYDHPYSIAMLSQWVQVAESNYVFHNRFPNGQLALNFHIVKANTPIGYQWLQAFMVYCLGEKDEQAALLRIEAFIKRGIVHPKLTAENALVANVIELIRKTDSTPLSVEDEASIAKMNAEINQQRLPLLTLQDRQRALLMLTYSSLFTLACDLGKLHIIEYFLRNPELTGLTADDVAICLASARIYKSPVLERLSLALQDPKIAHLKNAEGKTIVEVDRINNEHLTQYELQLNSRRSQFSNKPNSKQQSSPSRVPSSVFYHRLDQEDENMLGQSTEKVVVLSNEKRRTSNLR